MEKRQLGQSDLLVSKIALGCMSLGTDKKKAEAIINTALEHGINYFDTADLYNYGVNEEIVGETLKSVRDDVIIATKVGNRWDDVDEGWRWDPSKQYIKQAVKNSLRRLQTDYIDLYQLHGGTIQDRIEETIEAFEELQQEGLIRYYGISSIRPNVINEYVNRSNIVSNMMQYSLLDRRPEEWMPLLNENGISIVTRGSLAKGLLSDTFESRLDQADSYLQYSAVEIKELHGSIKEKLGSNRSMIELALQFVLSHDTVAAVVTGASSSEQVLENIRAANVPSLSKEEVNFLKELTKADQYTSHRS